MKSNPEFQEAKSDPIGENADSRCSQRFVRRCLRWGERALILALLFFTIRVAFTNVAETAAAESVPLEESSPSRVAQNGEANRQHGPRDSDANQKSDAARAPVANAPTPVEEPPSKRSKREPGPAVDEPEPAVAKGDKIKERTGKRLGILRLNGDHASDIEAVYSEAALVWGLGG